MKPNTQSIDPETLRRWMRQWSSGVTVVSAAYDGVCHGMTVNSFTSIAIEPPLILVSLARATRTHPMIEASGAFGVTILNEDQQLISERFAGRTTEDENRFAGLETFTLRTGAPFLTGGLAFFDCRVYAMYPGGAFNTLFLGEVIEADGSDEGRPLLYYNRDYHRLP